MNAFEQLKEVIEDARYRGGCYDAVVDALSDIIDVSDRLGDGWYRTSEKLKEFVDKDILIELNEKVRIARYVIDDSPFTDDDGNEYQYSHWFSDEFGDFISEIDEVKYWQPSPEPPKE